MMLLAIHIYRVVVIAMAAVYFAGTAQAWITWLAIPMGLVAAYDAMLAVRNRRRQISAMPVDAARYCNAKDVTDDELREFGLLPPDATKDTDR